MRTDLVGDTIEFLIELSATRVEARHLSHGVVVADVLHDTPRLQFRYPDDIRAAKRAPLLFDGQRSLLVVDPEGRARKELQRHRFDRLVPGGEWKPRSAEEFPTWRALDAFPLELGATMEEMTGGGAVAAVVARAAIMISARPGGAVLAVVDDPASLEGVVSPKDRYDLRNDIDPTAMRPETRLTRSSTPPGPGPQPQPHRGARARRPVRAAPQGRRADR